MVIASDGIITAGAAFRTRGPGPGGSTQQQPRSGRPGDSLPGGRRTSVAVALRHPQRPGAERPHRLGVRTLGARTSQRADQHPPSRQGHWRERTNAATRRPTHPGNFAHPLHPGSADRTSIAPVAHNRAVHGDHLRESRLQTSQHLASASARTHRQNHRGPSRREQPTQIFVSDNNGTGAKMRGNELRAKKICWRGEMPTMGCKTVCHTLKICVPASLPSYAWPSSIFTPRPSHVMCVIYREGVS